jgi:hypothetical protein
MVGIGLRLAQDVGAHRRRSHHGPPTVEDELSKRAFWCAPSLRLSSPFVLTFGTTGYCSCSISGQAQFLVVIVPSRKKSELTFFIFLSFRTRVGHFADLVPS